MRQWLINKLAPFILKYYKWDFDRMVEIAITKQTEMIRECVEEAKKEGLHLELHLDPTTVPLGVSVYMLQEEGRKENPFTLVNPDDEE